METIKLTKNLWLHEYIPKETYILYKDRLWLLRGMIDERLVISDQKLRDIFGPVTINNWMSGGARNASGLRTPQSTYFSPTSQHAFGRASDKIFQNYEAIEVQKYIKKNWCELGVFGLELGVNWVHSDVRYSSTGIQYFKP